MLAFLIAFFGSFPVCIARPDEQWLVLLVQKRLENGDSVIADFVRRDSGPVLSEPVRDLFRMAYGVPLGAFQLFGGAAVAHFPSQPGEFRLFQQLNRLFRSESQDLNALVRLAFEQRWFGEDPRTYFRLRAKVLVSPFRSYRVGPVLSNEVFLGTNGANRFADGINENRFGLGMRFSSFGFQSLVVWTSVWRSARWSGVPTDVKWLQWQLRTDF